MVDELQKGQDELLGQLQWLLVNDKTAMDEESSKKSRNSLSGLPRQLFKRLQTRLHDRKERIAELKEQNGELKNKKEDLDIDLVAAEQSLEELLDSSSSSSAPISSANLGQAAAKISALMADLQMERTDKCRAECDVRATNRKVERVQVAKTAAEKTIAKQEKELEMREAIIKNLEHTVETLESGKLAVQLKNPLKEDGKYDVKFRYQLQKLAFAQNIPDYRLGDTIVGILALVTNQTEEQIEQKIKIPCTATLYRDAMAYQTIRNNKLKEELQKARAYNLIFDGGDAGGKTMLPVMVSYKLDDGLSKVKLLSTPVQASKTSDETADLIFKRLEEGRLLSVACDSTAVNPKAIAALEKKKHELIQQGISTASAGVMKWEGDENFFAFNTDRAFPMPRNILFHPDVTHVLKNAELKLVDAATKHFACEPLLKATTIEDCKADVISRLRERYLNPTEALADAKTAVPSTSGGGGASNSKEQPEVAKDGKDALMAIARLMGLRGGLLNNVVKALAKDKGIKDPYEKMPGEVAHRFNIKTKIADVLHKFYAAMVLAFERVLSHNSGKTSVLVGASNKALVSHAADALMYLYCPSVQLHVGCMAAFRDEADSSYSRFNIEDGLLIRTVVSRTKETCLHYEEICKELLNYKSESFEKYVAWAWPAYAELFELPEQQRKSAWIIKNFERESMSTQEPSMANLKVAMDIFKKDLNKFCDDGVTAFK